MKRNTQIIGWLIFFFVFLANASMLSAQQQGRSDSTASNKNGAGIPNSGNTLNPNNGPEFPHSSFPVQSTDPGPLFHGSDQGGKHDSIPDPQKGSHAAPIPWP